MRQTTHRGDARFRKRSKRSYFFDFGRWATYEVRYGNTVRLSLLENLSSRTLAEGTNRSFFTGVRSKKDPMIPSLFVVAQITNIIKRDDQSPLLSNCACFISRTLVSYKLKRLRKGERERDNNWYLHAVFSLFRTTFAKN